MNNPAALLELADDWDSGITEDEANGVNKDVIDVQKCMVGQLRRALASPGGGVEESLQAKCDALERDARRLRESASSLSVHVRGHFALPTATSETLCKHYAQKVREQVAAIDALLDGEAGSA